MNRVSVRLPTKPPAPRVVKVPAEQLFQRIKLTQVSLPALPKPVQIARTQQAVSLQPVPEAPLASLLPVFPKVFPAPVVAVESVKIVPPSPKIARARPLAKPRHVAMKLIKPHRAYARRVASPGYALQVAHFSSFENTNHFIRRLRAKGFPAHYEQTHHGYKVLVGSVVQREEVLRLQHLLYNQLQVRGFVVATSKG